MKRKGVVGQILTSFPSLVFVFVIMLVFVIISGFLAKDLSNDNVRENLRPFVEESTRIDSNALFDAFLEEKVSKSELNDEGFKGELISVGSLINIGWRLTGDRQKNILNIVQKRFNDKFSDSGKNKLVIVEFDRKGSKKTVYINYPSTFPEISFPAAEVSAQNTEYAAFCLYNHLSTVGYSKVVDKTSNYEVCVYVEVV